MTMNPTPDHLRDEILSALLDGDAGDDGAGPDAVAHLRACDRCAARQAELAGARAALAAAPVEPLDDLARRRMVAVALASADDAPADGGTAVAPIGRARWARRHPALVGSVAATVLALLAGVPFVVGNHGTGRGENLTAAAPLQNSGDSFLGDLGDLTDRDRLRLRLSGAAPSDTYAAPAEAAPSAAGGAPTAAPVAASSPSGAGAAGIPSTTTAPPAAGRTVSRQEGSNGAAASKAGPEAAKDSASADQGFSSNQGYSSDQSARDRADTDACVAALLNGPARGGRLTRAGTGTYRGRPAIVASFELSGGTEAFITDRSGCAVLDRFSV
jgi:hypothetical protein